MKRKHQLFLGFISTLLLIFVVSCEETEPGVSCEKAGDIVHTLDEAEGRIIFSEEFQAFVIIYHVPNSIDAVWWGVVCNNDFPDFEIEDNQMVRFSGNFRDDFDQLQLLEVQGGQEFFYFEATGAVELIP
jgi:hypothetical protein